MRRTLIGIALGLLWCALAFRTARAQDPDSQLQDQLRRVADQYRSWGRVDDELRWAPFLCRLPNPSQARVSEGPTDGHGQKIYFVYARDRNAYFGATRGDGTTPLGQVVVKESFHPRQVSLAGRQFPNRTHDDPHDAFMPVQRDGVWYGPGDAAGLYVMMYLGDRAQSSDRGWVYGTIATDGRVTSSGRVESCMGCHQQAPHGRLFGLRGAEI